MKTFMKDYVELCKMSGEFYKKHWKGVIVLNAVSIGAEFAWYHRDKISEKFGKKEEES